MPPRYSYWTIIAGGLPTAFRSAERDELLPTFSRIKEKHPDAEMQWFARGKLWNSPEDARSALTRPREEQRGKDWRPGGGHRDPRQKFKDAKRARNLAHRQRRWERKNADTDGPLATGHRPQGSGDRPQGWARPQSSGRRPQGWARPEGQGAGPKGKFGGRPKSGDRQRFGGPKPWAKKPWEKDRPEGDGSPWPPRPRRPGTRPPRKKA
jgi:hypothetical protein